MPAQDDDADVRMLASGVVYEDNWMRLRRDEIERRDGSRGTYAFVQKPNFALVIPAEDDGFHMVEEYRYPIGRRTWSFPQGGWPHGETGEPGELARLELAQETGLRARELVRLGCLHTAHGITDQAGYYFLATGLEPGAPERESEEQDMRQAWVSRARFEEMIGEGLITDDSTVAAYALLLLRERGQGWGLGVYYVSSDRTADHRRAAPQRSDCVVARAHSRHRASQRKCPRADLQPARCDIVPVLCGSM